jgi:uncharacterized delta-60 repeat protein
MKKILLFLFALATMATQAQTPGDIAQTYGKFYYGFNNNVNAIATQADGKIIVGGDFTSYNKTTENRIIRLNSDGSKDATFVTGTGFGGAVNTIEIQADGKILIGGNFTTYKGVTENRIIRLNSDGSKDTTFVTGSGFNNSVQTIVIYPGGTILVGGNFTSYKGATQNRIIRLTNIGNNVPLFVSGTGFDNIVNTIATQTDGKILVGGNFTLYNGASANRIIRLNSDGSNDTTFTSGTRFNLSVSIIAIQTDGKILVGGLFTLYNGATTNFMTRLNSNGSKDSAFNLGTGIGGTVNRISLQADGKILTGGYFTTYNGITQNRIIRLNSDGSKDTTFTIGTGFDNAVIAITLQSDGKILIGGIFTTYNGITDNKIIRLNSDGSKDSTFNLGTGFNETVHTIAPQTDGKILIGGAFTNYNQNIENRIIRLNSDGSKDAAFITGTGFNARVWAIAIQADGKLIVGGEFTTYNGVTENRIIRLNSDGSKDTSFITGTGFNTAVTTIALQSDGKILIGGAFTTYMGNTENRIIRLNTDGTKDATFVTGTGFGNTVQSIVIQSDSKIVVGGEFITYNGGATNEYFIIRLNSDGSKDTTFVTGSGFNNFVYTIKQQADGKILVGGEFDSYNGIPQSKVYRLNSDGSLDNTFGRNQYNGTVWKITPLANGKIIVGGYFTTYNNSFAGTYPQNRIIQLNSDGSRDATFNVGLFDGGFDNGVFEIVELADGKILVGGSFTSYKGDNSSAFLIKLHTEQSLSTISFDAANAFVIYPNPVQNVLHLQANNFTSIKAVKIYDLQGKVVLQDTNDTINVSNLSNGLYIVKISTEEGEVTKKFIKE